MKNVVIRNVYAELPAWGTYIRHTGDVTLKNIIFRAEGKEYHPAIVADDVSALSLSDVKYEEPGAGDKNQLVTYKTIIK